MIKTSSKTLFLTMSIMSTMMVLSSSNWLNLWIGMEINLMSFIPLMYKSKNSMISQSSMMYFLIQSLASIIFMMMILLSSYYWINMSENLIISNITMLTMMMKLGMPPFHMWFPEILSKMKWEMCMMLMTWQKIAPMYILAITMNNNKINMMIIMLSTLVGAILGLNHASTRKIMAYSSINHMGWLMACAMMYKKLWMMYMAMYTIMVMMLCLYLKKHNIMYINQFNMKSMNMSQKINIMIMMLSMGGLPPFLGFLPKWLTMEYMVMSNEIMLLLIMVMSSLITMTYYMRMITYINMLVSTSQKWDFPKKSKPTKSMMISYVNLLLPMMIPLYNFM